MDPEDKKSLCTSRVALVEDLEPQQVLGYLIEDGILTENDVELISNGKTRKERCHQLLSMLPKRGPSAYGSFQRALRATNMYPHLDTLLRTNRQHYTKTSAETPCLQGETGVEVADYENNEVETAGNIQRVENSMVMTARCGKDYGECHVKNAEKRRNVCYKCRPFVPKFSKKSQVSQICRRHCCLLLENIEPIDIIDLHIQEQLLSDDDCERIRMGSTRKERCKTFLHCLANSHDDRVVSVLKQSLKKKYSYIVDTINENANKFEKSKNDTQMLENTVQNTIVKQYVPNTNNSTRSTIMQPTERNHDEIDGSKPILSTEGRGEFKSQYSIAATRMKSAFIDKSLSADTDEEDLVSKLCKTSSKTRKNTQNSTRYSHHQSMGLVSSVSSDAVTIQPGAIAPYELSSRLLVVTFNFLSSIINQGNFKRFESLSSYLRKKYYQDSDMLCLLGYFNASTELFKTNITSAKKHIDSALKIAPKTSNPKYFTLELFTVKTRIYIMRKKMEKLQEIMDDAKMIIEADPVGCTGRASGWLYLNESRSIMIQTGILNFRKKRSFDTYTWLHEKAKTSLRKALANFQEDGGKDGPFGFGYALCLLVILLLRCGENGLTMGVLSPPEEDVKQAGDLLQQLENSEIPIPKILDVDHYVAKSDYQYRRGNIIRAFEHAQRAHDLAIELNMQEIVQHAYNRLVFLRAKKAPLLIRELNEEESDWIIS
ncbi:hypothetical protein CHS0354_038775 [Potamilus streckersoni]|uniref:CARD domain-containing protein n=1 Tax=Potamilus streckersoni TaxID=2493646 RepID=A0AAE0W0N1_9BIVA|nr:hypothetical protein CHS0354_038775 [Potamilus streckersoni]